MSRKKRASKLKKQTTRPKKRIIKKFKIQSSKSLQKQIDHLLETMDFSIYKLYALKMYMEEGFRQETLNDIIDDIIEPLKNIVLGYEENAIYEINLKKLV